MTDTMVGVLGGGIGSGREARFLGLGPIRAPYPGIMKGDKLAVFNCAVGMGVSSVMNDEFFTRSFPGHQSPPNPHSGYCVPLKNEDNEDDETVYAGVKEFGGYEGAVECGEVGMVVVAGSARTPVESIVEPHFVIGISLPYGSTVSVSQPCRRENSYNGLVKSQEAPRPTIWAGGFGAALQIDAGLIVDGYCYYWRHGRQWDVSAEAYSEAGIIVAKLPASDKRHLGLVENINVNIEYLPMQVFPEYQTLMDIREAPHGIWAGSYTMDIGGGLSELRIYAIGPEGLISKQTMLFTAGAMFKSGRDGFFAHFYDQNTDYSTVAKYSWDGTKQWQTSWDSYCLQPGGGPCGLGYVQFESGNTFNGQWINAYNRTTSYSYRDSDGQEQTKTFLDTLVYNPVCDRSERQFVLSDDARDGHIQERDMYGNLVSQVARNSYQKYMRLTSGNFLFYNTFPTYIYLRMTNSDGDVLWSGRSPILDAMQAEYGRSFYFTLLCEYDGVLYLAMGFNCPVYKLRR